MQSFKQCEGDSKDCSNSLPPTTLNTNDHDLSNYLKLRTVSSIFDTASMRMKKLESKFLKIASLSTQMKEMINWKVQLEWYLNKYIKYIERIEIC